MRFGPTEKRRVMLLAVIAICLFLPPMALALTESEEELRERLRECERQYLRTSHDFDVADNACLLATIKANEADEACEDTMQTYEALRLLCAGLKRDGREVSCEEELRVMGSKLMVICALSTELSQEQQELCAWADAMEQEKNSLIRRCDELRSRLNSRTAVRVQ